MNGLLTDSVRPAEISVISDEGALNVVVVNDSACANGGTARVAISEACQLARRGHRVIFVAGFGPVDKLLVEAGVRVVLTEQDEITKDPIPTRALLAGIRNVRAERAVDTQLRELSVQHTVVHLHGWTKCLSASVIRLALARQFPIVCTLHDYFSICPNGGLYDFQRQHACHLTPMSWSCIARQCDKRNYGHKLYRVLRHWAQQQWHGLPENLRYFITVSSFSSKLLVPHLPPEATFYDLPNPIDVERQVPSDPGRSSEFLFVGRLSPEKGPGLLAQAAADGHLPVTFVGDGPERGRILETLPSATITGWLPPAEVAKRLRGCRAIVCPTVCYETQGIVVQEAAAMGIPAIVADGCAAREAVENGVTGLWFRSGDVADLQEKITRLADSRLAAQLGRAAYDRYWSMPMTPDVHAAALEDAYRSILRSIASGRTPEVASSVSASVAGMSE